MNKTRSPQKCRACLEPAEKMYPLVGPVVNVDVNIATMLSFCTSSEIDLNKNLPSSVCVPCFKTIRIAYNFLMQFKESQNTLKLELKSTQNEVEYQKMKQTDMSYSISEDGIELSKEKIESPCDTDENDDTLNITEKSCGNYDLEMIHTYADRSIQSLDSFSCNDPDIKDVTNTENSVCKFEIDVDEYTNSLIQYVGDERLSDELKALLPDPSDSNIDKFIIVNETTDSEVEIKRECISVKELTEQDQSFLKTAYHCPLCSSKFDRFSKFNEHILLHNKKKIVCDKCATPVELNTVQYLQHYKEHHRYHCNLCNRSLMSNYGYRYHMKQHENVRNYKCPVEKCSKSFFLLHLLKKHMRTHSDEIKYTCELCKATFKTYDTFRYHQKTHDGKRNHLCTQCGKAFFQAVHLRDHMFRHIGFKAFTCNFCGHSFTTNSQLKKHSNHCMKIKVKSNKVK